MTDTREPVTLYLPRTQIRRLLDRSVMLSESLSKVASDLIEVGFKIQVRPTEAEVNAMQIRMLNEAIRKATQ